MQHQYCAHIDDMLYELLDFRKTYCNYAKNNYNDTLEMITGTKYTNIKTVTEECNEVSNKIIPGLFNNIAFRKSICNAYYLCLSYIVAVCGRTFYFLLNFLN